MKAPVAGSGDGGSAATARPGRVDANTWPIGWIVSTCRPSSTQVGPGILLDRDGTMIVDHRYVGSVDRAEFIERAPEATTGFNRTGIPVAVLTNHACDVNHGSRWEPWRKANTTCRDRLRREPTGTNAWRLTS